MDDLKLRDLVEEELEWEPSVDAADIGVAVDDGVVTLLGHVGSFAEKLAAEAAAKRVSGVRAIAQEIIVEFGASPMPTDEEIAKRAVNVLDWDVSIPKGQVQAKVQKGVVTLTGKVNWRFQAEQARNRISSLPGVRAVSNLIKIKPAVSTTDIKDRIEKALHRNADLEAQRIRVAVADGKVTLSGTVEAWHDRDVAERAAWSAPGVTAVEDNIGLA